MDNKQAAFHPPSLDDTTELCEKDLESKASAHSGPIFMKPIVHMTQSAVNVATGKGTPNINQAAAHPTTHMKTRLMIIFVMESILAVIVFMLVFITGNCIVKSIVAVHTLGLFGIACGVWALKKEKPAFLKAYYALIILRMISVTALMVLSFLSLFFFRNERGYHSLSQNNRLKMDATFVTVYGVIEIVMFMALCLNVFCLVATRRCEMCMRLQKAQGLPTTNIWGQA